jgi:addiction module HigA family antidote
MTGLPAGIVISVDQKGREANMAEKLPDVHPGEILFKEFLEPMGISAPPCRIDEIVLGKRAIPSDPALRLARYFGTPERFWLGLQVDFDRDELH